MEEQKNIINVRIAPAARKRNGAVNAKATESSV